MKGNKKGISAALASAFFLGMTPIFGKQAILLGMTPMAVVATRTILATLLLLAVVAFFYRPYLFIYPAGLLGCLLAGAINGIGSLFYYSALGRINANLGHLLYSLYPLFLVMWLSLDRQPPGRLTLFRLALALPAIFLLTQAESGKIDLIGVAQMLIASALYALHLPINQRVLYDMPPPTVTLYTLIAMSVVVVPAFMISGSTVFQGANLPSGLREAPQRLGQVLLPVLALALVTFFSRLSLFTGIKHLGGMQTALLGLSELLVALTLAYLWLGERFTSEQWIGAALLCASLALVAFERPPPKKLSTGGFLSWLGPAGLTTETWQPHD
jgi:drug/metabolite transporter (DMT)-like permease